MMMQDMNNKRFVCEDCEWKEIYYNSDGSVEEVNVSLTDVPLVDLVEEWENLLRELSFKKDALNKINLKYKEKSFNIKYIDDIDFKELYGKANDDVRKYHAEKECRDLIEYKESLEISIKFLEQYLRLIDKILDYKLLED